ncbi:Hypothetical predicted protein [Cloeon dipterum]|uniref:CHAT domain-containing protein n=1 Tax=Cloeon dipterum TaxID=197152 RepID=A0A8S1CYX7_9INSE|nr:Hypothetical predicted protein [Cloeon dipterum]
MSQRDLSENELEAPSELPAANRLLFLEKVRQSNAACQSGDFANAIALYTEALLISPGHPVLLSNRSAARIKLGDFQSALQDALAAREAEPRWPKAYFRQGVALQCLGRHGDALAAFSSGLGQDPKSTQLLNALIEAAMKSPLRSTLDPTFRQLKAMKLDSSPFVIISVVGQELLAAGLYAPAVVVLEAALRIGTCSLKLRGSVFSALSSAYWALNSLDKAISYMQQDLAVAKSLGDIAGECRAHGNLGSAYFSKGSFKEALTSHRYQLVLAMKCRDTQAAAAALTSLGHVYTAIGDYPNALASHKQCVQLVKQMGDTLQEAREIGNVGAVYLAMGDFDSAVDCHTQHLRLAKQLGNKVEEARAYSNLGSSHHFRRNFEKALAFHEHVLRIALKLKDRSVEARAYAGLGHAARCMGDYTQARKWHERQLDSALATRDRVAEGRACSNLGIVYQLLGDHDAALKLHQAHLAIARALGDRAGMGRAYGNMGNAHSAMGYYEQAIKLHKQELTISKEVNDRSSEASTHGNLAVAYQALGMHEKALMHYRAHLNIARELKDAAGEACALLNLGNCHSSRAEFNLAVPFYENYLMLSQEMHDVEGEGKACHLLGYAHYCLGNYKEAVRYYDQDLALAKDLQDRNSMARAYCNLGLAHLALGAHATALECQKYFLAISHMTKNAAGKFRALGNMGDVLGRSGNMEEAVKMYARQLALARNIGDRSLEAAAYGALGRANRTLGFFDKALGFHTQELTLRQEMSDVRGECRAHGQLGAVHMSLGNYTHATKCYSEQLERAREVGEAALEAQAYGNLGIARLNMGHYEDAIGYLEQQLATLEPLCTPTSLLDKGRALGNLGDCYEALGDWEEAIRCHEQHLNLANQLHSPRDQERAFRGLGNAHQSLGHLQQSLVCFEKRLVVAHELGNPDAKMDGYGDLGQVHAALGQFEPAVSCLQHQLSIARDLCDKAAEGEAASGLGSVLQKTGDLEGALRHHTLHLALAEELEMSSAQAKAHGNLGVTHEALGNMMEAQQCYEKQLELSIHTNDQIQQIFAYSSLGRVQHALGDSGAAANNLARALSLAQLLGRREEEAKARHRLGLALWAQGDISAAASQLERSATMLETLRKETKDPDGRLALFDLQTACYQALVKVLVSLGRSSEALLASERARSRAHNDLIEQRRGINPGQRSSVLQEANPASLHSLLSIVDHQKAAVLYFSISAGCLLSWCLVPGKGVVRFSEQNLDKDDEGSILENYIQAVRETLGVEIASGSSKNLHRSMMALSLNDAGSQAGSSEPEMTELWSQHLEQLGERLNHDGDRTGFLRMVNRNHAFNCSNYSLSSLFSVASGPSTSTPSRAGSQRSRRAPWQGPACISALYHLLIAPFDEVLTQNGSRELLLVLDGDLILVPFPVLRSAGTVDYLCERFSLLVVPSLSSLSSMGAVAQQQARLQRRTNKTLTELSALVVGNPKLPASITEQWGWNNLPLAEQEAIMVGELLQTSSAPALAPSGPTLLVGKNASKQAVLTRLTSADCIHFSTHVSWQLSAIVLAPPSPTTVEMPSTLQKRIASPEEMDPEEESSEPSSEPASLSEFLLTAADLVSLRLRARLVVLSSCHTREQQTWASADGVVGLTRALLASGVQCVLLALWPVPDTAAKILLRAFYSALFQGARVSRALAEAMTTVQHTKHFTHPANWAGFVLVGADVRICCKGALVGQALGQLLGRPSECRDALRVSLHLIEKSLQRIQRGQKNAMYTTQKSIENKVGEVPGWRELLMAVGFRFEPAAHGIPASVFFPQNDTGERLSKVSSSLQALLGLSATSLHALSRLLNNNEAARELSTVLRRIQTTSNPASELEGSSSSSSASQTGSVSNFSTSASSTVEAALTVKLWREPGVHELLASLGLDLMEVGQNEVTLRTGKQASRRNIQFALTAVTTLFESDESPRSASPDWSSVSDEEGEVEESDTMDLNHTLVPTPGPLVPQNSTPLNPPLMLGRRGAFTSYVRRRGEPDGRTAVEPGVTHSRASGGRESDAAFTPSPVEPPALALSLLHQTKIKNLYTPTSSTMTTGRRRPDSSSSASSSTATTTDWEGAATLTMVRRHAPLPTASAPPLPPANLPTMPPPRHSSHSSDSSDIATPPQRSSRLSVAPETHCIQDHIIATQLRRLQHQLAPISDVYHERRLGLGLAPTLSSLLMEQAAEQQSPSVVESTSSASGRDQGDGGLCSLLEELAAENTDSSSTSGTSSKLLLNSRNLLLQSKVFHSSGDMV